MKVTFRGKCVSGSARVEGTIEQKLAFIYALTGVDAQKIVDDATQQPIESAAALDGKKVQP